MIKAQKINLEKILFLMVMAAGILGFVYFEESLILKILVICIALFSLFLAMMAKKNEYLTSHLELATLLTLFLGSLTFYNLLYNLGLPLWLIMLGISFLNLVLFYFFTTWNRTKNFLDFGSNNFWLFCTLMGLTGIEVFLGLYFWPVTPEIKGLIMVVIFYFIANLVYLYINNVLNLKRIISFLILCLIVLGTILLTTYIKIPK